MVPERAIRVNFDGNPIDAGRNRSGSRNGKLLRCGNAIDFDIVVQKSNSLDVQDIIFRNRVAISIGDGSVGPGGYWECASSEAEQLSRTGLTTDEHR